MRLELVDGEHRKFWEVQLRGRDVIVRWGRIGSAGQTTMKSFDDEAAARVEHDKLVREKTRKGYVVVEGGVIEASPVAVRQAPERVRLSPAQARERAASMEPTRRNAEVVTWTLLRGEGAAREFCEVSVAGREIEVSRGKIGRAGRARAIALEAGESIATRAVREIAKALIEGFTAGDAAVPTPDIPDEEEPLRRRAEAFLKRHMRTGYVPSVEDGEGALLDSRFGGRPALSHDESSPRCGHCEKPLTLIAQLNHETLPESARKLLPPALIQLFWCDSICQAEGGWDPFSPSHLARAIEVPRPPRLPRADEMPEPIYGAKHITGWTPVETYPGSDELSELVGADEELEEFVFELRDSVPDRYGSRPGGRLLGWPAWIQGVVHARCSKCLVGMAPVLQIDSGTPLREIGFGDSGIAFMLLCPRCRAMTFTWQSC